MILAFIAALARNRVIGNQGATPWQVPEDLARFRVLTQGHTLLMGRRTFEAIGRPLPGRRMVVVTRTALHDVPCFPTPAAALHSLRTEGRIFVVGGGQLFAALLPEADELYLTLIDRTVPGDTYFPPYEDLVHRSFTRVRFEQHDGFAFVDYVRRTRPAREANTTSA
jgi:dihydrofolate reductase